MNVIDAEGEKLGGIMWFVDPKHSRHCAMYLRKGKVDDDQLFNH